MFSGMSTVEVGKENIDKVDKIDFSTRVDLAIGDC